RLSAPRRRVARVLEVHRGAVRPPAPGRGPQDHLRQRPRVLRAELMELAELVDGLTSGVGWPGSSKRGASLLFSAKSALDPRRETRSTNSPRIIGSARRRRAGLGG